MRGATTFGARLKKAFMLSIAAGLGIAAAIMGVVGCHARSVDERIIREGVDASAVVVEKNIERNPNADTTYTVKLHFTDAQGQSIESWIRLPKELWDTTLIGQTQAIRYLPAKPQTLRVVSPLAEMGGEKELGFAKFGGVAALVFFAGGVFQFWRLSARSGA